MLFPTRTIVTSLILAFAALAAFLPQAQAAGSVVDTAFVVDAMKRGAIVWDTRSIDEYKQGHIPGSVTIGDVGRVLRDDNTEDYIALDRIEKLLGSAGIDPAKEVVVYGAKGNPFVYFALVTLQYFGSKQAYIYHGGIDDWRAAGRPSSTEPASPAPVALTLQPSPALLATTREVIAKLRNASVQIVDVRTPKEFSGEDIRALRGGHIPGAINIPYEQNWVDPEAPARLARKEVATKDGLALKSVEQLKALYARLDPNKETIVYCQSGVRASETATVLRDIGFRNVRVYDSSWLAYGNTFEAPAENVTYFNVGLLNGRIAAMQKRIETLEKELAQARQVQAGKPAGCTTC
ncbi:MAG: sulfurtransferase [Betaproteobacteria bacterium]|nr:sulfurtransferase [Betaproteobacteria bacterium]